MSEQKTKRVVGTIAERFWPKVSKSDGCWTWTAAINKRWGYGAFREGGKTLRAHRVAWALTNGPIPDGLFACHHCDNPSCVNPSHIFLGTCSDNAKDMAAKGRSTLGDRNPSRLYPDRVARGDRHSSRTHPERIQRGVDRPNHKLLNADVIAIRSLFANGATNKAISERYGISRSLASAVAHGKRWQHVE